MENDFATEGFVGVVREAQAGALLRLGPAPLSVVWANASRGIHVVGLGVAAENSAEAPIEWVGAAPPSLPGPWFGGWAFDATRPWAGFATERWVLPEVVAWWHGQRTWLAAFAARGSDVARLEARLEMLSEVEPMVEPGEARIVGSNRAQWERLVVSALDFMRTGHASKIVTARVIDVEAPRPWSERAVMKALEARHPQCFSFLVRGTDGSAFVGASPELLCEAEDGVFVTEALAGTAMRGQGSTLLGSEKERREHHSVIDGIRETLEPFAANLEIGREPVVKVLSNVEHLHTPIRARLKPTVAAVQVARALHPTPAVAGRPKEASMRWLAEHEGFSRGWYTGAVGARGGGRLTLAVALRSALLRETHAQVFVGAGIVEGSEASAEWLETERKARAVLPALGVHDG